MTVCGCKGVRYCAACETSDRVVALKSECFTNPVDEFHLFCVHCTTALPCSHNLHSTCSLDLTGVRVCLDFVSDTEEMQLTHNIDKSTWQPSQSGRLKQDYGPRANYKKQKLKLDKFFGLPAYSSFLRRRLHEISELQDFIPVEQCNLQYHPDQGSSIDFHFDDFWLWGERLIIINLLSDSAMLFNYQDHYVKVPLPRRSLIVMRGDGRDKWKHAIVREDIVDRRISVTFRELSQLFLNGERRDEGQEIIEIAANSVLE